MGELDFPCFDEAHKQDLDAKSHNCTIDIKKNVSKYDAQEKNVYPYYLSKFRTKIQDHDSVTEF